MDTENQIKISSGEFIVSKEETREFINDLREAIETKRAKEKEQRERELLLQLAEQMQREHIKKMEFNAVIGIMAAVFSFLMLLILLLKYC